MISKIFKKKISEEKQIKLINLILEECNKNTNKIIELIDNTDWEDYLVCDDGDEIFVIISLKLYLYDIELNRIYDKKIVSNIMFTLFDEYSKLLELPFEEFFNKIMDFFNKIDVYLNQKKLSYSSIYIMECCDKAILKDEFTTKTMALFDINIINNSSNLKTILKKI